MIINHNSPALNAIRNYQKNTSHVSKDIAKLSSGLQINSAADDAAGLAISEKMRAQIRGIGQALRNAWDGISTLDTADGGMEEIQSILHRMRELCVEAANDTLIDKDRLIIQQELGQLREGISSIAYNTEFNTIKVLQGNGNASASIITTPISINIDYDGLSVPGSTSINVGGYLVDFEFNWIANGDMEIIAKNNGAVLGTATATPSPPGTGLAVEWQHIYNSADSWADCLNLTNDGGFIIAAGGRQASGSNRDGVIIKTDANGNVMWEKTLGSSADETVHQIIQTGDGGYIVVGMTNLAPGTTVDGNIDSSGCNGSNDFLITKLDANGNIQWQNTYGGSSSEYGMCIMPDGSGNYIIGGFSESINGDFAAGAPVVEIIPGFQFGVPHSIVFKIDSQGNLLSSVHLNSPSAPGTRVMHGNMDLASDGGFMFANGIFPNGIVYKFNSLDINAGYTMLDFTAQGLTSITALVETSDGGFLVGGDNKLVKVDSTGGIQWIKNINLASPFRESAIIEDAFGNYIISGPDSLVKIDANTGNTIWAHNTSAVNSSDIKLLSDGSIVSLTNVAGKTYLTKYTDNTIGESIVPMDLPDIVDGNKTVSFNKTIVYFDSSELNEAKKIVINALITETPDGAAAPKDFILHIGANVNQQLFITLPNMNPDNIGLTGTEPQAITQAQANASLGILDSTIETVSSERARLGAIKNRLEYAIANAGIYSENISNAESRLRDLKMAESVANYTKKKMLLDVSTAMIAQANSMTQDVLTLLR